MSNSSLVTYTRLSPHYDSREGTPITDITIHHMAGNLTVYQCGEVFQTREASANYGIDGEGRVGLYVEEKYASWANANAASNRRSITIELANDEIGGQWHVSDTAIEKCIDLCVDICKRNNIDLVYTGDTSGTLTRHNMFYATACPGPYLQSKFPYIESEVRKRLNMKNGWLKEDGKWYFYKDNTKLKKAWAKDSKGLWYWLGEDGAMVKSKTIEWKNNKYYLKEDGAMASNEWVKTSKGWRFFQKNGKMKIGWLKWKNNLYYLDGEGYMVTGGRNVPCTFDKDGKLVVK